MPSPLPASPATLHFNTLPLPMRVLLLSAQPHLPAFQADHLRTLAAELTPDQWDDFLALALHHRVDCLVYQTVQALQVDMPEPIRRLLQKRATANALLALRAAAETRRICQRFKEAGLALTSLKGITLSQRLYDTPNARNCGDIDLLTSPDDLARQIELMAECGFHLINPEASLTPRRTASYRRFWKDFTFCNPDSGFELDLHWRLFNNRLHPANQLLKNTQREEISVFGLPASTLPVQETFLYTAAHGVSDAFTYLKSLADVAGFLRVLTPAQLESALLQARDCGLLPQVSAAIHLAGDWMLIPDACPEMNPALLPRTDPVHLRLRAQVESALLAQRFKTDREATAAVNWWRLEWQLVPGVRSLLELVTRFLFRPRVWTYVNLPDALFPLYAPLGLLLPPRLQAPAATAGQSQAAPRTPLESPKAAGSSGVSNSPPKM